MRTTVTRQLLLLLLAAVACATSGAERATAPTTQRVMSFNIRYGTAPDGKHVWSQRRHLVFRVIREFDPGVLGVQEALRFQLDEIGQAFPNYRELGAARDDGKTAGEYSAILYDARSLDVLEHGTFWLSDTPEVPGSMSWGNRFVRIATWARLRDRNTHASFYVFNTHWDHESQPARERSAALILDRIRQRAVDDPVLLLGDFNAGEDNAAFQTLLAGSISSDAVVRLVDTFRARQPDARDVGTFHTFRGERAGAKIDAILASPHWQVLDAAIVTLAENGLYPSDHFPVTARVRLPGRQ